MSYFAFDRRQIHISIPTMVQAKKFIYAKRFVGLPKVTDFRLEEETLPALGDGGKVTLVFTQSSVFNEVEFFQFSADVLVEAVFLSVDPYMRAYMDRYEVGVTMIGGQVAK